MRFMLITLKNDTLEISADSFGAELHSLKYKDCQYLWQCGDAWKRYAPVLFPFVCSPTGKKYIAGGKEYTMPSNHGFARDSRFELLSADETSVSFVLKSSEETRKVYPYDFEFTVTYKLSGNKVEAEYKTVNKGSQPMYFYTGAHPAFNCPLESGLRFNDYYVKYDKPETITQSILGGERTIVDNDTKVPLSRELFDYDVFMKDTPESGSVTLKSDKSDKFVTVEYESGQGCIAVWSPTGDDNAAFVCLEPWTSVPVYADDEYKEIEKKPHAIKLEAGMEHSFRYNIVLG